jgi:soluble lytic murein transglycosylase-like protein
LVCLAAALPLAAGEEVILTTGFRLRAERHQIEADSIHLYNGGAVTTLPLSSVAAVEPEDYVPPQPLPPAAVPAAKAVDPKELVTEAALRQGLPPALLHSIAQVESGYRQDAVSPKGALGIMQLMPQTAKDLGADPSDPAQNVDAGARYLRELLLKYLDDPDQVHKALAAYNAGPGAVDRYDGIPPYRETIEYVRKVLERRRQLSR